MPIQPYLGQVNKPGSIYPIYGGSINLTDPVTGKTIVFDGQGVGHVKLTLTSAQILALNTTPIALIPAPGAGYAISVLEAVAVLTFKTTAYTGTNDLNLNYTNGSGVAVTAAFPHATFMNGGATNYYKVDSVANNVITANAAVVANVPTANPAAGDSTITIDVAFRVVALP